MPKVKRDRFLQILTEYQKAPAVTRQRLYLETLEEILANSTKVLIDGGEGDGSNNLLYLPLDRLVQNRPSQSPASGVSRASPGVGPSSSDADSLARLRSRETR